MYAVRLASDKHSLSLCTSGRTLEGGGQIIRNSLALAVLTGIKVRVHHVRGRRSTPGLRNQHVVGALALAKIGAARYDGIKKTSCEFTFEPGCGHNNQSEASAEPLSCCCEGAGSVSLLIQSVMPCMLFLPSCKQAVFRGGTIVVCFHFKLQCGLPFCLDGNK